MKTYTQMIRDLDLSIQCDLVSLQHCDGGARSRRKGRIADKQKALQHLIDNQQLTLF